MNALRRVLVRYGPQSGIDMWRYLRLLMGDKRHRLLLQPVVGLALVATETAALLVIVKLLLMLAEDQDRTVLAYGGVEADLSFLQLGAVAIGVSMAGIVARYLDSRLAAANAALAIRNVRSALIRSWFATDWEHVKSNRAGHLQQLLALNSMQAIVPISVITVGSTALIGLMVAIGVILFVAPAVAVVVTGIGLAVAAALSPFRRWMKRVSQAHSDLTRDLQLSATSYVALNRELHVFGSRDAAVDTLETLNGAVTWRFRDLRFLQRLTPGLFIRMMMIGIVVIILVSRGFDLSAEVFGVMAALGVRALSYIQMLNAQLQQLVAARPFLDEIAATITEQSYQQVARGNEALGAIDRIDLRSVGYEYEHGVPALADVELTIRSGEWIGVIGPSGGGKTTLCNIIAGLLSPTRGEYLVDGHDFQRYSTETWTRQFGLLSQEPTLLRATAGENISFHREATDEEIRRAAAAAGIDGVVESLTNGYDSPVGEGHSTLSGGQRQRLALARTLMASPSCIILDEPTSALDTANEDLIRRSLAEMDDDTIVIVVSHRPALLDLCTRFITISDGHIERDERADQVDLRSLVGMTPAEVADDEPAPSSSQSSPETQSQQRQPEHL